MTASASVTTLSSYRRGPGPALRRVRSQQRPAAPTLTPALVGVIVLIASEAMFFGGLLSAYIVLRAQALAWPPPGQPYLPSAVTAINSLVLFASAYTMYRARLEAYERSLSADMLFYLALTAGMGFIFLAVQGTEWVRLVRFGLTLKSSLYGAIFYTIVGAHGLHVVAAMGAMAIAVYRALRLRKLRTARFDLRPLSLYWWFVVVLWAVIYVALYLT